MISVSSVVIRAWRARLNLRASALPILLALSVAAFIATIRATCSATTASLKHWNSVAFTASGSRPSSSSPASGLNSYTESAPRFSCAAGGLSGSSCKTSARCRPADTYRMDTTRTDDTSPAVNRSM